MDKEKYLDRLNKELSEFDFKGSIREEYLSDGVCFHIVDSGWCIERGHKILKTVIRNLEVFCRENGVDDGNFFILID